MNTYRVTEMDPMGYGNPEAKISYRRSVENGEFPAAVLEKPPKLFGTVLALSRLPMMTMAALTAVWH